MSAAFVAYNMIFVQRWSLQQGEIQYMSNSTFHNFPSYYICTQAITIHIKVFTHAIEYVLVLPLISVKLFMFIKVLTGTFVVKCLNNDRSTCDIT